MNALAAHTDRELAIVGAALLEYETKNLLHSLFVPLSGERQDRLRRHIDSYDAQVELLFALGTITEQMRKDLSAIGSIRNKFAHRWPAIDFAQKDVLDKCKNLITINGLRAADIASELNWPNGIFSLDGDGHGLIIADGDGAIGLHTTIEASDNGRDRYLACVKLIWAALLNIPFANQAKKVAQSQS